MLYWVLTKRGCAFCVSAKELLRRYAHPYRESVCETIQEARDFVGMRWHLDLHQTTFPVIVAFESDFEGTPVVVGGYENLVDSLQEPMLVHNPTRHTLYPIHHPDLFAMYKKGVASFWTPEEVSLVEDRDHWKALTPDERYFVSRVLAFFAGSDGIVQENLGAMFCTEVQWAEARQFYAMQIFQEAVHSEQYSLLIDTLIDDPKERDTLFNATDVVPCVRKKAAWAAKWITPNRRFAARLMAFVAVEGVLFSGSFCAIYWLKQRGLMPGLALSNEWISRDEALHYSFGCALYRKLRRPLPAHEARAILTEAVDCEIEFICEAIPCSMVGMNRASMEQYIKFVADRASVDLGYDKLYNVANPFPFMELQSLSGTTKTNFFERTASEYQRSGVMAARHDQVFDINGAF